MSAAYAVRANGFDQEPAQFGDGLPWVFDDGGRAAAGFRGEARDCVARAWSIALERPYAEVYDELASRQQAYFRGRADRARKRGAAYRARAVRSARDGIARAVIRAFAADAGWVWYPTMAIGTGTTVHMRPGELPDVPRLVAQVSRHVTAVLDGVVRDTFDPSRGGARAVYGYWIPAAS